MDDVDGLDDLEADIDALEQAMGGAQAMAAAFHGELTRMGATIADTSREVGVLSRGIDRGLRGAIDGLVFDGEKLSDALQGVARSMLDASYSAAIRPVTRHVSGMLGGGLEGVIQSLMPFAAGGAFTQGRVMPFAKGGVVAGATAFPMRNGTGLMGEAGPEAIMPLTRGPDGRLGVQAEGGGRPVTVVMNITTPDAQSFQRSQSQIAAQMSRAVERGRRNH